MDYKYFFICDVDQLNPENFEGADQLIDYVQRGVRSFSEDKIEKIIICRLVFNETL